ncbi:MAG: Ada metal-binding domain-containing protein [Candidatus Paceibacteria bacterium]
MGLLCFGLGRLSVSKRPSLDIIYKDLSAQALPGAEKAREFLKTNPSLNIELATSEKAFFASKRGKKYYSLDCSAGKSIKQENRVYFDTAQKAEAAGYSLSASCE